MLFQLSSENWEQDCLSLLLKCWELGVLAKAKRLHVPALGNCRGLIVHCMASTLQGIYNNSRDEKAVIEKSEAVRH